MASVKFEEVVAALDIPNGAERQRFQSPGIHGFLYILISVNVLSKLKEEIFGELDGLAGNHGSWDQSSGDSVRNRELFEPELHDINELVHEDTWYTTIYLDKFLVK